MPKRSDINHEYWHLRENDPGQPQPAPDHGASRVDIKFSFGNCVYGGNEIKAVPPYGYGAVHHAIGTLRMRHRWTCDGSMEPHSVVDEDLRVAGAGNLHVCDMSVMPFSSAANPVRTLVAPAPRLIAPGGAGEKWRPAGFRRAVSVR